MNLPDFSNDGALNRLREEMGADLVPWVSEISQLAGGGIDVLPEEIDFGPGGTLIYKGRTVAIYIRDQRMSSDDPELLCKFHVADCSTLKAMRSAGRYERYVVTTRTDGKFIVNFLNRGGSRVERKLYVCKNCLSLLNYKNYRYCDPGTKSEIRNKFSLKAFFEKYGSLITKKPIHTDITAPINKYPPNWNQIARRYKEDRSRKCEICYFDLGDEERKRFLHVHHKNGLKYDNDPENLLALCIGCHADQPQHQHLKSRPDYEEYSRLRGWRF